MRTLHGTVVSNKMTQTVVVRVDRLRRDPKYRKQYRVSKKYKAAAEKATDYRVGDVVAIEETRPMSKEKRWKVVRVIKAAPTLETAEETQTDSSESTSL